MEKIAWIAVVMLASICIAVVSPAGEALAQQKQKITYKVPAADTKYTQRNVLDVGDEVGHQLTLFEIHRSFPNDPPVINGIKLKETWTRGYGDYVDNNGASVNYTTYTLENGDKFVAKSTTMGQADAGGKRTTISVGQIVGGTGKLVGIRGVTRAKGASDGKAGYNESQTEIEYWFAK